MTTRREKAKKQQPQQLNKQLVTMQAEVPRKEKNEFVIELGKFFLDLAKLTFGGMFLTAIMDVSFDMEKVINICAIIICSLAILGLVLIKKGVNK